MERGLGIAGSCGAEWWEGVPWLATEVERAGATIRVLGSIAVHLAYGMHPGAPCKMLLTRS